jgi:hypothetical protein
MMNAIHSILLSSLLLTLAALAGTVASPPGPRIELHDTNHDFGRVMAGQKLEHHFWFTNTGNATSAVHTTCGCTTEGGWSRRVEPSKPGWIEVQFDSARMEGPVAKSLTVVCSDSRQANIPLSFKALVWKPIDVFPALASFNVVGNLESNRVQTVRITNHMTSPLELSEPRCTSSKVSVLAYCINGSPGGAREFIVGGWSRGLRIEYPGAVYHGMARDNNQGCAAFRASLGEACEKTGWRIHAHVRMAISAG